MLYHFTSCEALLKIILCNSIKFSKSINLDDPFERNRSRNYIGWIPQIPKLSAASKNNGYFNSLVNLTNILCFFDYVNSKNNTIDPLCDLKMWSHYGRLHRGCCLVLNKKKTISEFLKNVEGSIHEHGRVEYNDLHNYIPAYVDPFQESGWLDNEFKKLFHNLFFNKGMYYIDENEYRFVVNNRNSDFSLSILPLITKIVIAENANDIDISSIIRLCSLEKIEVGRMIISNDKLKYFKISAS